MDASLARDLFLTNAPFEEISFYPLYQQSFYGLVFMPVICKRTGTNVNVMTPYSWEEFVEFEKFVHPILKSYNFYSPTYSLLVYLKNKNTIIDFDTESCEWLGQYQKQIILNEHKYWESMSKHHRRTKLT